MDGKKWGAGGGVVKPSVGVDCRDGGAWSGRFILLFDSMRNREARSEVHLMRRRRGGRNVADDQPVLLDRGLDWRVSRGVQGILGMRSGPERCRSCTHQRARSPFGFETERCRCRAAAQRPGRYQECIFSDAAVDYLMEYLVLSELCRRCAFDGIRIERREWQSSKKTVGDDDEVANVEEGWVEVGEEDQVRCCS